MMAIFDRTIPKPAALLGPVVAFCALAAATDVMGEPHHVRWTPNLELEAQMEALKKQGHLCLPEPYQLNFDPYVVKLASSLYDNCVTANTNVDQVKKYALLAAVSMSPAAAYSVPYTVSELKSDAVKCVLKSFVGVSSLGPSKKASFESDIDDMFTIKDWKDFSEGAAGLSKASSEALDAAMTQTALAATDRVQDTSLFSRAYNTVAGGRTLRFLKELWWDGWIVALDEYEFNIEQCRFEDARLAVQRAEETADEDCLALGHQYRSLEAELVSDIIRTYNTLDNDLIGDSNATITIVNDLERQKRYLERVGNTLSGYEKIFAEIKGIREDDLSQKISDFEMTRLRYEALYKKALDGLNTPRACEALTTFQSDIDRTLAVLGQDSHSCREALFGGQGDMARLSPRTLRNELLTVARSRSSDWWVKMDQIWASQRSCDMRGAFALQRQLLSEIANNPIYRMNDGVCSEQNQQPLLAELDALDTPEHCEDSADLRMIPHEIIGVSAAEATKMLQGNDGFFVVPEPKNGSPAANGQSVGDVQTAFPAPGTEAARGSTVQLIVATAALTQITGQTCPVKNLDPSRDTQRKVASGTTDDKTYVDCTYFEDGRLKQQAPVVKGQRHGEYLLYAVKPGCDWYRRIRKVYEGNEKQAEWLYVCEAGTGDSTIGNAHLFAETKYVNGLPTVKTQFYPNGHPAITTTFDSEGKRKITKSWSQDGTPTGCEQIDQDGKSGPCSD
ncbi:PASTA domain-containing protein [uncultured Pelagimonas sp.]|uniref:PASTA domain-containing protein n=1 Tax=uncultured Pelagimonas sp. TaxID=1618102 RepID=UPI0026216F38|nr:PASTA domain-containing protein [uncultured Pelagimonas sp.]